jgi:type I restriction enzyme S subunit
MNEWRATTLAELASPDRYALATGPFGSAISAKHFVDQGVPVLRGSNLSLDVGVRLIDEGLAFLSPEKAATFTRSMAHPGDLVFTCWGTVGQVGLIDARARFAEYVVSNKQMKLTPDPLKVDSLFLYYLLSSAAMLAEVQGQSIGAAVPGFNLGQLRSIRVRIPPVALQRRIAGVLGNLDDLIDNNRRRIELLQQMAQAIYREWFVRFRYPGHENVPLVESPLGSIPKGWTVKSLGSLSTNFDRLRKPLSRMSRDQRSGSFPYYGAAKLIDWIDDWIFDGEYLLFAEDGTVQTTDGFPVLQLVDRKFWANNHTHILQGCGVSTRFLFLASAEHPIAGYVTGAAQPKITQANLNRIPLIVGSASVQKAFDTAIDPILDALNVVEAAIAPLAAIRDFLLPKLVTGQIDVSNLELDALADSVA